jgi:Glycosyl transferase family 2
MSKFGYSLVACSRWEECDIVEWVEYHKSIGFDHIYVYSNDDDPQVQFNRLQPYLFGENPFVTYLFWPIPGQQLEMYFHFIAHFKDETTWACFLDVDEFVVLKGLNDIRSFMSEFEDSTDCVYFNWVLFGNNGKKDRDNNSVLKTLTKRSPSVDVHTKTIFKTACITEPQVREGLRATGNPFTHFWNDYPFVVFRMCNVLHDDVSMYADRFPKAAALYLSTKEVAQRIMEKGYVAHFQFKSEADFVRRAERGGFAAQSAWRDRYMRGEHLSILAGLNAIDDDYLKRYWESYTAGGIKYPAEEVR